MFDKYIKYITVIISIAILALSLREDAFFTDTGRHIDSATAFFMGWVGYLSGSQACVSWFANVLLIAAWVRIFYGAKSSAILGFSALFLSLSFLLFDEIMVNEAGNTNKIAGYESGYWLWILSIIIVFVGSLILYFRDRYKNK